MRTPATLVGLLLTLSLPALAQTAATPTKTHAVVPATKTASAGSPKASAGNPAPAYHGSGQGGYVANRRAPQAGPSGQTPVVVVVPGTVIVPAMAPASVDGTCTSASDCNDGTQGHGAVCDRASAGMGDGAVGVCRDACRDYNDCPTGSACVDSLDPDDRSWLGCVPQ